MQFMNENHFYSTWLEIDLSALQNNISQLKEISHCQVMAVVKANAYGHGLVEIAKAAEVGGANWFGAARIEEALTLRKAGITNPILVLGFTPPSRAGEAAAEGISLAIYDPCLVESYVDRAREAGKALKVHVKVDTGMARLGLFAEEAVDFTRWLKSFNGIEIEGVFTHFARADEPDQPTTDWQIDRFEKYLKELDATGLRPSLVHACNSAGTLNYPRAHLDMVRPGIAIYGLQPSPKTILPAGFNPIMTWKSRLISVKEYPGGYGVSYGHRYVTKKPERIGVIATGYADGFRRIDGNFVLVRGQRVPVIGSVCMDQCMLQLDSVPEAQIGDEVVLIGRQGNAQISAEEAAQAWGTICYELVCGMADRIPRLYIRPTE